MAALAAAGADDPVAAHTIATELLNRLRRAPYLGAFLVSSTIAVLIVLLDRAYTGTFLLFESGARAIILILLSLGIALFSLLTFSMWRFRFLRPPSWLPRNKGF